MVVIAKNNYISKPTLFKYNDTSKLNGRNARFCSHQIASLYDEILDISVMEALYTEKIHNFVSNSSGNKVFTINKGNVSMQYFLSEFDNIKYLKVLIVNNSDYPIYYTYTFGITIKRQYNEPI